MITAADKSARKSALNSYDRRKIVEFLTAEDLNAVDPDARKTFRGDSIERWALTIRRRSGCNPTATNDEVLTVWRDHYNAARPIVEALETTPKPTPEEIWQDAADAAKAETGDEGETENRPKFRLEPWDATPLANPREIVTGIVEEGITGGIVGRSGRGKSFVTYDLACCIATGTDWHGRKTKQKRVALIVGEGRSGALRRLHGWSRYHGIKIPPENLLVSSMGGRFTDPAFMDGIHKLLDEVPVDVLVIDTLNRNAGAGFNENDSEAMTEFVRNLDALREAHALTVLVVHHTGWGPQDRARGSSVFTASLDAEFIVARDDDDGPIVLTNSKMKDSEPPPPMAFELRQVVLDELRREDGSQVTTAVLVETDTPSKSTTATGKHQKKFMAELQRLESEAEANVTESGRDSDEARVSLEWLERELKGPARNCPDHLVSAKYWQRTIETLLEKGLITIDGPHIESTEHVRSRRSRSHVPVSIDTGEHWEQFEGNGPVPKKAKENILGTTGTNGADTPAIAPERQKWLDDHAEELY